MLRSESSTRRRKSDALWDKENNEFAFKLEYCKNISPCVGNNANEVTHTQDHFPPFEVQGNIPKEEDYYWQYPSTSLLMADPYKRGMIKPDTSSWPNMDDYIRNTCSAIKADGITIYVVGLNQSEDSILKSCATDNHFYTANNLEALANTIKLDQSSSDKRLRLIR